MAMAPGSAAIDVLGDDTTMVVGAVDELMMHAGGLVDTSGEPDLPVVDNDAGARFIVGFYELPEDQDDYGGDPVLAIDEDLTYFLVKAASEDALRARAVLDENVRYVESDISDHKLLYTPNDYFWNHASNWGVKKIGAVTAWDVTLGTTAVKDGHIDSGINRGHEEWASTSRDLAGWDYYNNDNTPQDTSGCSYHGTHTSGTVAAPINNAKGFPGMAQINLLPVKIFGGGICFAASTTNIANAIKYVGNQGSHVSSNSWGGGAYSQAIHDAITYSVNLGVTFVASSGNGGCSNCVGNPWKPQAANTIIVSATDSNDAGASFNSKGPEVDVSAPGVYVGSSTSGTTGYHIMDGTSMACPHVTGLAALIKTKNPTFTAAQITSRITGNVIDLGVVGKDDTFGYGRINAAAAVF